MIKEASVLILLAEDNRGDVGLILHALQEYQVDHELLVVDDGEKAIKYIELAECDDSIRCPDLILLDLNLPKKDGEQVLTRVRISHKCAAIPVVILTSSDSPQDRAMAERLGATKFFHKPSDLEEFMKIGGIVKDIVAGRFVTNES